MKKKHKILLGMLVLAGCLLFGCEKRRTELFSEEKREPGENWVRFQSNIVTVQ